MVGYGVRWKGKEVRSIYYFSTLAKGGKVY